MNKFVETIVAYPTPFIGFLASLPSGWDGLHQAFFKLPREPLAPYSLLEMVVSLVLLILAVYGIFLGCMGQPRAE